MTSYLSASASVTSASSSVASAHSSPPALPISSQYADTVEYVPSESSVKEREEFRSQWNSNRSRSGHSVAPQDADTVAYVPSVASFDERKEFYRQWNSDRSDSGDTVSSLCRGPAPTFPENGNYNDHN